MTKNARILAALIGLLMQADAALANPASPVVAELFESQGCSSCPPAERVMKNLQEEFGPAVILLAYHVDYWDYLGWKDPFSDALYTDRQKEYARIFSQDAVYTPELVIQGETGFNGSDLGQAREEISSRLKIARLAFALQIARKGPASMAVSVQLPPALDSQTRRLILVVYENAAPVHVLRGENRGATMSGDFAVRRLAAMPQTRSGHSALVVATHPSWNQAALGIGVLVQGDSGRILSAQAGRLGSL